MTYQGGVVNAILKDYYLDAIRDQLNSSTVLLSRLRKNSEAVEGKQVVLDVNTGRNNGHGHIAERGRLPDPLQQEIKQARYSVRYYYGRIMFTGPSASSSRTDRGSFVRQMDLELNGLVRDMLHDTNRVFFGNGTGRLCRITATGAAPTYTVDQPGGLVSTGPGTQYLERGMRVCTYAADTAGLTVFGATAADIRNTASATKGALVTAINHAASTITLDRTITGATANTDYLYTISDLASDTPPGSTGRGLEPWGLAAIIDDSNPLFADGATNNWPLGLGEIDANTVAEWRAPVIDNGGTAIPFSPDMFQQAMDIVQILGDGAVGFWLTTHGIRRQYLNGLVAAKRYPNTMDLDGGFKTLTYDGRPIVVDKHCTRGRVYGIDEATIQLKYETDYDWMDQDGSILHRLPDMDAFQACLYRYHQLCTDKRNANVAILDIQDV